MGKHVVKYMYTFLNCSGSYPWKEPQDDLWSRAGRCLQIAASQHFSASVSTCWWFRRSGDLWRSCRYWSARWTCTSGKLTVMMQLTRAICPLFWVRKSRSLSPWILFLIYGWYFCLLSRKRLAERVVEEGVLEWIEVAGTLAHIQLIIVSQVIFLNRYRQLPSEISSRLFNIHFIFQPNFECFHPRNSKWTYKKCSKTSWTFVLYTFMFSVKLNNLIIQWKWLFSYLVSVKQNEWSLILM